MIIRKYKFVDFNKYNLEYNERAITNGILSGLHNLNDAKLKVESENQLLADAEYAIDTGDIVSALKMMNSKPKSAVEINENPNSQIEVDLLNQSISILNIDLIESFEINNYKKQNMLNGFDDIDYLINIKSEIEDFAKKSII